MRTVKTKQPPCAVVIGLDHYLGLQTARLFARRGVPVIGLAKEPGHFGCRTRVCREILFADILGAGLIKALVALGQTLEQKAVLVPCRDMSVLLISRHREMLAPYFHFALPPAEVVELLMDKLSFYEFALEQKLPVAKFRLLRHRQEAESAARDLSFPCILKPPLKSPLWEAQTRHKAFKIFDTEEFLARYDQCSPWADVLMAQEWITGSDANNYSCNAYFDANSRPLVTFVARKLRQWPPETGNTSLGIECRNRVVLETALRLFGSVGFHGLAYLEMKRDQRTGQYFIIEPNIGRPTGRSALAEASSVELLYTMYCDQIGWPLPPNREQKYLGVKWIYLRQDLQSAFFYWRRGELTLRHWWRSLRGRKTYAVLSWADPLPFLEDVRARVLANARRLLKKWLSRRPPAGAETTPRETATAKVNEPQSTVKPILAEKP
ncbi:MAG: carboxylate--amine ligase [bacterium]